MNILVVGSGAREHAIVSKLAESSSEPEIYAFMGAKNPGIMRTVKDYHVGNTTNPTDILNYALKEKVDTCIIGPEKSLRTGVVDELENRGIMCIGPKKVAAQLETNKVFALKLLDKYDIPANPTYKSFTDPDEASKFIDYLGDKAVIKPAGPTGGKGVKIVGEQLTDAEDAKKYARHVLKEKLGDIEAVIVEEKIDGEEFTLQAFVDGHNVVGTPAVKDYKRAYEGNIGPNTGGMGSFTTSSTLLPFINQDDYDKALGILEDTVRAVKRETGTSYIGFLNGQFIATPHGPKVLEFNARLGDPETMNIMATFEGDFMETCERIIGGTLKKLKFTEKATVVKYVVPQGYPINPAAKSVINVNEKGVGDVGGVLYYGSVHKDDGLIMTSKSRSVGLVGIADSIAEAEVIAEESTAHVTGDVFHRRDIGTRRLVNKSIENMKRIRG